MSRAYYNEIDPFAAAWLRNLIAAGHIAPGDVDERDIRDVRPDELRGYTQCHFFAGTGAWSYALRLAGWSDDRPVWTGSCPCQPFSAAGRRAGLADERHLWPAWYWLIRECRPCAIFGEQVASRDAFDWLDVVSSDLEAAGYACGPVVLPAAGIGAPHGRHRTWFMAHDNQLGCIEQSAARLHAHWQQRNDAVRRGADGVCASVVDNAGGDGDRQHARKLSSDESQHALWPADSDHAPEPAGAACDRPGYVNGFWRESDWLPCTDGRARPVEPGTFPLAHGATARVGRLRAYGNAIVPEAAALVIEAAAALGVGSRHHGATTP